MTGPGSSREYVAHRCGNCAHFGAVAGRINPGLEGWILIHLGYEGLQLGFGHGSVATKSLPSQKNGTVPKATRLELGFGQPALSMDARLKGVAYVSVWVLLWGTAASLLDTVLLQQGSYATGSLGQGLTFALSAVISVALAVQLAKARKPADPSDP